MSKKDKVDVNELFDSVFEKSKNDPVIRASIKEDLDRVKKYSHLADSISDMDDDEFDKLKKSMLDINKKYN